ncbi:MAG TPA: hypothetical protein VJC18_05995 [bacterium]|nr:hypothetical protein [bacterium]
MNQSVALWSVPRSCSTALLLSVEAGGQFSQVFNEPFGEPFFHGPLRLSTRYQHEPPNTAYTFDGTMATIEAASQMGTVCFKEMANHVREALLASDRGKAFLRNITHHAFIVRHPSIAIVSLARPAHWPDFTLREAGYEEAWRLFEGLQQLTGRSPVCLDGTILQKDPIGLLSAFFHHLGLPFDSTKLAWTPANPRLFGKWAHEWYAQASKSRGIEAQQTHAEDEGIRQQPHVQQAIEYHMPFFNRLAEHFL